MFVNRMVSISNTNFVERQQCLLKVKAYGAWRSCWSTLDLGAGAVPEKMGRQRIGTKRFWKIQVVWEEEPRYVCCLQQGEDKDGIVFLGLKRGSVQFNVFCLDEMLLGLQTFAGRVSHLYKWGRSGIRMNLANFQTWSAASLDLRSWHFLQWFSRSEYLGRNFGSPKFT